MFGASAHDALSVIKRALAQRYHLTLSSPSVVGRPGS